MKIFEPNDYPELRNLFPELTPGQFENSLLCAFGLSQKEIAAVHGVSQVTVNTLISQAKAQFETKSLTGLLTVIHVRLVLFALYGCQRRMGIYTKD